MSENARNSHPQDSTDPPSAPGLPSPQFSQCAWRRRQLDAASHPVGDPLPDLAEDASHGICTTCADAYFPTQAARLRVEQP